MAKSERPTNGDDGEKRGRISLNGKFVSLSPPQSSSFARTSY